MARADRAHLRQQQLGIAVARLALPDHMLEDAGQFAEFAAHARPVDVDLRVVVQQCERAALQAAERREQHRGDHQGQHTA
jgi:hypothetical protein